MTSQLLQHIRRLALESFQSSASAALLACVGVALAVGVVASSAPVPALSFAEPKEYAVADGPDALAIGDLNGDGRPDLVTANGKVTSVLLNRGDGSFRARLDYRNRQAAYARDRRPERRRQARPRDRERRADSVSVLLNRGNGSFGAKLDYATGGPARSRSAT